MGWLAAILGALEAADVMGIGIEGGDWSVVVKLPGGEQPGDHLAQRQRASAMRQV